jgi:hypothetical protein
VPAFPHARPVARTAARIPRAVHYRMQDTLELAAKATSSHPSSCSDEPEPKDKTALMLVLFLLAPGGTRRVDYRVPSGGPAPDTAHLSS